MDVSRVCADITPLEEPVTQPKPFALPPRVPTPAMAEKKPKSPWASINDVLIQNRCWLCLQTFPRGKMKKVFQVSDLLTFYHNHMQRLIILKKGDKDGATNRAEDGDGSIAPSPLTTSDAGADSENGIDTSYTFISENLQRCYDSYVELMNAGEGQPTKLFAEFKECDVEVWMSGLVCAGSAECKQEAAYFIESTGKHTPASDGSGRSSKREVNSMFTFAIPQGTECPPGCGCDNPWPFMP